MEPLNGTTRTRAFGKKEEEDGCQDSYIVEDSEKADKMTDDVVQRLDCGIAVASDGETCQPTGHSQLVDVSCEANRDDIEGNQGELKKKHSVMDLLPEHETAANERAIVRKCKHNQRRSFVCGQIGEPDEETLKREALEAILQETKRAKMRADACGPSGWLPNRTGKPNRRFLSRLLTQAAKHGGAVRSKQDNGSTRS